MTDIIDKLREIEEAPIGGPIPKCLSGPDDWNWATPLIAIAKEARLEIERLRAIATTILPAGTVIEIIPPGPYVDPHQRGAEPEPVASTAVLTTKPGETP